MPVVTVSRQYASLGDEIATTIANRLQLRRVDQEIINEVAQRLGVTPSVISARDEREGGIVSELARTMRRLYPATMPPQSTTEQERPDEAAYLQVIRQVIWEVAREGNAVIVGRGAPFILAENPEVLHVLVAAPAEVRVERVVATEGLSPREAQQRLAQVDSDRSRYIRHFYRANWLDVSHYDLVINTGHFSELRCVDLVCSAVADEE